MARQAFGTTLGGDLGEGRFSVSSVGVVSPSVSSGTASGTLTTNVAAAVAVLVADGASPTQAHVNTLNTAWGLLATAIAAANTATTPANVFLDVDTAVVTTQNGLRAALRDISQQIRGSGLPS